jgi:hypothetical protein
MVSCLRLPFLKAPVLTDPFSARGGSIPGPAIHNSGAEAGTRQTTTKGSWPGFLS